jgi:Cu/Ag efflux protein CusF
MMKTNGSWITAAGLAGSLCLVTAALAAEPAKPAAAPHGEAVISSTEVTATVTKIDHKTREVTLKANDGEETSFVAGPAVKNLAQVKKGDVLTATYTEAVAYQVRKSDKAPGAETTVAAATAKAGAKPAGVVGQQTTLTVAVAAIDPKAPSVTFKGPGGETRTIKVRDPAKLQGVSVGDVVDLTYGEAIAVKVEKAPKK